MLEFKLDSCKLGFCESSQSVGSSVNTEEDLTTLEGVLDEFSRLSMELSTDKVINTVVKLTDNNYTTNRRHNRVVSHNNVKHNDIRN